MRLLVAKFAPFFGDGKQRIRSRLNSLLTSISATALLTTLHTDFDHINSLCQSQSLCAQLRDGGKSHWDLHYYVYLYRSTFCLNVFSTKHTHILQAIKSYFYSSLISVYYFSSLQPPLRFLVNGQKGNIPLRFIPFRTTVSWAAALIVCVNLPSTSYVCR